MNGIVQGAVLALVAISLTTIYRSGRGPHWGLGGILVWGGFAAFFARLGGAPFWVAMGVGAVSMALLGVLIDWLAFRRLRGATEDAMFVSAIGVLMVMENSALLLVGGETRSIDVPQGL